MIKLKDILTENLLLEINDKTILYHRSTHNFNIGDKIKPYKGQNSEHWLSEKPVEQQLEKYRKQFYPNKPSRFDCVYLTLIPNSRFRAKGDLYGVRIVPGKNWHLTNSLFIDDMGERSYKDSLFNEYWNPSKHYLSKSQVKYLEILAEEVEVVESINESNVLKKGSVIELQKDFILKGMYIPFYDSSGNKKLTDDEMKIISKNKNIKILKIYEKFNNKVADIKYKKGTKFKVLYVMRADSAKYAEYKKYKFLRLSTLIPGVDLGLHLTAVDFKTQKDFLEKIKII